MWYKNFVQKTPLGKLLVLAVSLHMASVAQASVIPDSYDYVTLPPSDEVTKYYTFTALNNNDLVVGYGSRGQTFLGFIYNFADKEIIATVDNFYPTSINDSNVIAGVLFTDATTIVATCVLSNNRCDARPIEGGENAHPFGIHGITNSGFIAATQGYNTANEQFLLFDKYENLVYNAATGINTDGIRQAHNDIQRNNTRLIVGAYADRVDFKSAFVKIIQPDLTVDTIALPSPGFPVATISSEAVSVNSSNQIIISSINANNDRELYVCDFIGDSDGDTIGDCNNGLQLVGPGADRTNIYPSYPLNDHGLLVTPPSYNGGEIYLYDLNHTQSLPEPLSTKGVAANVFAKTTPLAVNNDGVLLVKGTQTILLVPVDDIADIELGIAVDNDPTIIPADGARMQFAETLTNNTNTTQTLLYWRSIVMPDGTPYAHRSPKKISIEANTTFTDSRARLRIPDYFPTGTYTYKLIAIVEGSGEIFNQSFQIIKNPQ